MSFKAHYANADVAAAFASLGLARGDVVYLSGNLGNLGFNASGSKTATLEGFLAALFEVIGPEGTVVVPLDRSGCAVNMAWTGLMASMSAPMALVTPTSGTASAPARPASAAPRPKAKVKSSSMLMPSALAISRRSKPARIMAP